MRKQIDITIADDNRDRGKTFRITEMPAFEGQKIADKVFVAAMNCGVDIPGDVGQLGMAELWAYGLTMLHKIPYEWLAPILDRMDQCVQYVTDAGTVRKLVESDIEEIPTVFKLRAATLKLHFDFFGHGGGLTSGQAQDSQPTTASQKS